MKYIICPPGRAVFMALVLSLFWTGLSGAELPPGSAAPAFDLPSITSGDYFSSSKIFAGYDHTFIIFWDSECPHCVESLLQCELFFQEQAGRDIAVFGIHPDHGDMAGVYQLIETTGITFTQLWDLGGATAREYGAALAEFSVYMVDRRGLISAAETDPESGLNELLQAMLNTGQATPAQPLEVAPTVALDTPSGSAEAPGGRPAGLAAGLTIKGDLRTRFLAVESRGVDAQGPYGEEITAGNDFQYRFELELSRRLGRYLSVGGLLRISNEPKAVLESGPKYLGSEWGSAYAETRYRRLRLRAGYYEIAMTPLTLMRWDWNDNPRVGGQAGCGCGIQAGGLLLESLEELGPELVFEGVVADYFYSGLILKGFYAIPRRANRTTFLEARSTGAPEARFSLEIFGAEAVWRRADKRTGSAWRAGLRLVGSYENKNSVDRKKLGYVSDIPWHSSYIVTADLKIPVLKHVDLEGEGILANRTNTHDPDPTVCCGRINGGGGLAGIVLAMDPGWSLRGDYLRLDNGINTPFSALSYTSNREGFRVSGRAPLYRDIVVVSGFFKRLKQLKPFETSLEKQEQTIYSGSVDVELSGGWGGSLGFMEDDGWNDLAQSTDNTNRSTLVAGAGYRFTKASSARIEYQRIDGTTWIGAERRDYLTNLFSFYVTARF